MINQLVISSLIEVFPLARAVESINFASSNEMDRTNDLIRPMDTARMDRLVSPIAIRATASAGFPASSPQKFIGVLNDY